MTEMMTSTPNATPPSPFRVKRKPAPIIPIEERYPSPDLSTPFASLADLRHRQSPNNADDGCQELSGPLTACVQTFHLTVDLPLQQSTDASHKPLPPRSPRRGTNYRGRSFSASGLLPPQNFVPLDSVCRQLSETLPQNSNETNESSPVPSLIHDLGSSDESGSELNDHPSKPSTPPNAFTSQPLPQVDDNFIFSQVSIPAAGLVSAPSSFNENKAKLGLTGSIRAKVLERTLVKLAGSEDMPANLQRSHTISGSSPRRTLKRRRELPVAEGSITPSPDSGDVTAPQLAAAAPIPLIDSTGRRQPFVDIVGHIGVPVLFVRQWSCPHSQSYVQQVILRHRSDQRLVIVGNGPHTLIEKYRTTCDVPNSIEIYTEPSLRIHQALGLHTVTKKDLDTNVDPLRSSAKRSNIFPSVFTRTFLRSKGSQDHSGTIYQLGGEFHMETEDSKLICNYVYRMVTPREHGPLDAFLPNRLIPREPILQPVLAPSEQLPSPPSSPPMDVDAEPWDPSTDPQPEKELNERDSLLWMVARTASLRRIKERRAARRATVDLTPRSMSPAIELDDRSMDN